MDYKEDEMKYTGTMTGRTRPYINKQDMEDIRKSYYNGTPIWKLAELYGATEFAINKIINGR